MVERADVVVPERAQRLREPPGGFVELAHRGLGGGAVADRFQHGQRRPEYGLVVVLEDPPPRLPELVPRALGSPDAVRAHHQPHRRDVPEPPLEEAGVGEDQGADPAHALGAAGVLGREVERVRDLLLAMLLFEQPADPFHDSGDLLGFELAGAAESGRRGDAGVDAVALDPLEVEGPLQGVVLAVAVRRWRDPLLPVEDADEGLQVLDQAAVVGLEGPQHSPDGAVAVAAGLKGVDDIAPGRHDDRDDDVAVLLARRLPHDAANGLDDVDLTVPGVEEGHAREVRDVDALAEQPAVRDHAAFAAGLAGGGEFAQLDVPVAGGGRGVQVDGFELHGPLVAFESPGRDVEDPGVHQGRGVPLRPRDCVREGDRPRQRAGRVLGLVRLGESVDGEGHAEHARHVVELRRRLPAAGLVQLLEVVPQRRRHGARPDAEDDDAVVGQHFLADRVAEAQPVEFRPVDPRVRHVDDVDAAGLERPLGALRVDPRGRRHVETLRGAQARVVVELLEVNLDAVQGAPVDAGGPVGLVGDGQIERGCPVPRLRRGHAPERVVRREHGARVAGVLDELGDPFRVSRDRALELGPADVLAAPAGGPVGADDERGQGPRGVAQPLAPGLRDQGDGGGREEDPAAFGDDPFGDAQRREGLARAAGHDQAPAVVVAEAVHDGVDGVGLAGKQRPHRPCGVLLLDQGVKVRAEVDVGDARVQALDGLLGVPPPPAGADDPPVDEHRPLVVAALRFGEERVDVPLAEHVPVVVALALDGHQAAVAALGDEVDADVAAVAAGEPLPVGPVRPAVDVRDLELGLLEREPHDELLEPAPLLGFVARFAPDPAEHRSGGRRAVRLGVGPRRLGGVSAAEVERDLRVVVLSVHAASLRLLECSRRKPNDRGSAATSASRRVVAF